MSPRSILALLLALAVVALCAWLPEITGYFQDRENNGNVAYFEVNPVSLTFTGEEMSMSERLYTMVAHNYVTQIPPSLAKMTPEEAEAVGEEMLAQMQAAGFLPDTFHPGDSDYSVSATPVIRGIDTETGCIFWNVAMVWDDCHLLLTVEDSTGSVCYMLYADYFGLWPLGETQAPGLAALFLGQLGEEFAEFDEDSIREAASWYISWDEAGAPLIMELMFEKDISGLQELDISLDAYGFTVEFF